MKPSGKCTTCKFVSKCVVETQTRAKVVECVYVKDFEKKAITYGSKKTN